MHGTSSSHGIAIPATVQQHWFSLFRQVEGAMQRHAQQPKQSMSAPGLQQNSPSKQQQVSLPAQPMGQSENMHPS